MKPRIVVLAGLILAIPAWSRGQSLDFTYTAQERSIVARAHYGYFWDWPFCEFIEDPPEPGSLYCLEREFLEASSTTGVEPFDDSVHASASGRGTFGDTYSAHVHVQQESTLLLDRIVFDAMLRATDQSRAPGIGPLRVGGHGEARLSVNFVLNSASLVRMDANFDSPSYFVGEFDVPVAAYARLSDGVGAVILDTNDTLPASGLLQQQVVHELTLAAGAYRYEVFANAPTLSDGHWDPGELSVHASLSIQGAAVPEPHAWALLATVPITLRLMRMRHRARLARR